jgi:hypothetical protein
MTPLALTRPVLVLDAGYQPVNVINLKRAGSLVYSGKAVVVQADANRPLRSEKLVILSPRVIRLLVAIAGKVYRFFKVRLTKRNIMARDGWSCQYCGAQDRPLTIDHVVPRSRYPAGMNGQVDSWENCVTACVQCNVRKGNRTRSRPARPRWSLPLVARRRWGEWEFATWEPYLLNRF